MSLVRYWVCLGLVLTALTGWLLPATASAQAGIELSPPEISNGVIPEEGYFTGPITLESTYEDDPILSGYRAPSYSIDDGVTWLPAQRTLVDLSSAQIGEGWAGRVLAVTSAILPDGKTVVVAARYLALPSVVELYQRVFDQYGELVGEYTLASTSGSMNTLKYAGLSAVTHSDNKFVLVWQNDLGGGSGTDIYAQIFTDQGTPLGTAVRVNTTTIANQVAPKIVRGADGGFVVAWLTDGTLSSPSGKSALTAQRLSSSLPLSLVGGEIAIATGTNATATNNPKAFDLSPFSPNAQYAGATIISWLEPFNADNRGRVYSRVIPSTGPAAPVFAPEAEGPAPATVTDSVQHVSGYLCGFDPGGESSPFWYCSGPYANQGTITTKTTTTVAVSTPSNIAREDGQFAVSWLETTNKTQQVTANYTPVPGCGSPGFQYDGWCIPTPLPAPKTYGTGIQLKYGRYWGSSGLQAVAPVAEGGAAFPTGYLVPRWNWAGPGAYQLVYTAPDFNGTFKDKIKTFYLDGTTAETVIPASIGTPLLNTSFSGDGAGGFSFVRTSRHSQDGGAFFVDVISASSQIVLQTLSITPTRDVQALFRLTQGTSTWTSEPRTFKYLDPNLGSTGTISYDGGYSKNTSHRVTVDVCPALPAEKCVYQSVELYQKTAVLSGDACGPYSGYTSLGVYYPPQSLTDFHPPLDDGKCYQFKALVTNKTGSTYPYTGSNTLKADRTPPTLQLVSQQIVGNQLTVTLNMADPVSGISSRTYVRNSAISGSFTTSPASLPLVDGANLFQITVEDKAGNCASVFAVAAADLAPPSIALVGFDPAAAYDNGASFPLYFTQGLTNLVLLVDGVPRPDLLVFTNGLWRVVLTGLASGSHAITVQGQDASGNPVTKTAAINVDPSAFSISIVSPQPRLYEVNSLTLAVQASRPTTRIWFTLDGGPEREDFVLSGLSNGNHQITVYAQSTTGQTAQKTLNFTVQLGVPLLTVVAPQPGQVLQGNQVTVSFQSDSPVSYQMDGVSAPITSGTPLTVSQDGDHTLVLTAVHPLSGNPVSQAVTFRTDSVVPDVTLVSPAPILYAYDQIPIEVQTNKPLLNVQYFLDGQAVGALTGLSAGDHTFVYSAVDAANRPVVRSAQFTVANLAILAPLPSQVVVSNVYPIQVPFQYESDGPFQALTVGLDTTAPQLITQPEGTVIPLTTTAGRHEVTLRGQVNSFSVGKRVSFQIGSKNVSAGPGSLDYTYANCDAAFTCDVNAVVKVRNAGTLDITDPFDVRFDQVRGIVLTSETVTVPSLAKGARTEIHLAPFRAYLGDTLLLTVDPDGFLDGEKDDDNVRAVSFQAGRIEDITGSLAGINTYLEQVHLLNVLSVATVGPVASIEVVAGSNVFVDNTPENGFTVPFDVGLLTRNAPCVQVRAMSTDGILLDSETRCYRMQRLRIDGFSGQPFPWALFSDNGGRVVTSTVDGVGFTEMEARYLAGALLLPVGVIPSVTATGEVTYRIFASSVGPLATSTPPTPEGISFIQLASVEQVRLNLSSSVCIAEGAIPITGDGLLYRGTVEDLLQKTLQAVQLLNAVDDNRYAKLEDVLAAGLDLAQHMEGDTNAWIDGKVDHAEFQAELALTLFYLSGGFLFALVDDFAINSPHVALTNTAELHYDAAGCGLVADDANEVKVVAQSELRLDVAGQLVVSDIGARLSLGASFGPGSLMRLLGMSGHNSSMADMVLGIGGITVDAEISFAPIHVPFTASAHTIVTIIDSHIYASPIHGSAYAQTKINDNIASASAYAQIGAMSTIVSAFALYDQLFTPGNSWHDLDLSKPEDRAKLLFELLPGAFAGFGTSVDVKVRLIADGFYQLDQVDDLDPFAYGGFRYYLQVKTRKRTCFMGICTREGYTTDNKLSSRNPKNGGYAIEGTVYTQQDVLAAIAAQPLIDVGAIDDLSEAVLYYAFTGQAGPAADALQCATVDVFNISLRPSTLYSQVGGVCHAVLTPDGSEPGPYFTNSSCTSPVSYTPTPFLTYCKKNYLVPTAMTAIGDASQIVADSDALYPGLGTYSKWTLAHGPKLDILALSPAGNARPYEKRVEYKKVATSPSGDYIDADDSKNCHLEMRIFKKDVYATNLKPAMVIYGGSWTTRMLGTMGLLPLVSQFTDRGYVVFAPYHRQLGGVEAPTACQLNDPLDNHKGEEIIDDVTDALAWVKSHGAALGADPGINVTLLGQSSGAHLAGVLAMNYPGDIRKSVLLYPPVDFAYAIHQWKDPLSTFAQDYETGMDKIFTFLGITKTTAGLMLERDLQALDLVVQSSLPARIANGQPVGPLFIIHGNADTVVPVQMSTRVCDALNGFDLGQLSTDGGDTACGPDTGSGPKSVLHVIDGADHALDLKCFSAILGENAQLLGPPSIATGCPPGSTAGEEAVRQALQQAMVWIDAP